MTENVAELARAQPWWVILIAPAAGGLLVGLMLQYLLATKRTDAVPDVMEARVNAGRSLSLKQGLLSALASALSLGTGASAGREGPIVHLGATDRRFGLHALQAAGRRQASCCSPPAPPARSPPRSMLRSPACYSPRR